MLYLSPDVSSINQTFLCSLNQNNQIVLSPRVVTKVVMNQVALPKIAQDVSVLV